MLFILSGGKDESKYSRSRSLYEVTLRLHLCENKTNPKKRCRKLMDSVYFHCQLVSFTPRTVKSAFKFHGIILLTLLPITMYQT